jgi:MFS transporter, SET family, sugar efflux transporter
MDEFLSRGRTILRQPNFMGLLAATCALGMAFSFVVPFLSMWGMEFVGMPPFMFGVFMTVTSLSAIMLSTTLARWSDTHVSRKVMLILGGSGGVLGYCGYAFIRDPWVLIGVGSTMLALASMCFSQLFAHVREEFGETGNEGADPRFRMSIVRVCFSVAWTVGPAIGAEMMRRFGFRGVFLGAASLYGFFLWGILRFVPLQPRSHAARAAAHQPVWRVVTRRDITACFGAFLLFFAAHAMNMMNLPLMTTKVLGGAPRDLGIIFGVGPVVEIPLMLWFGHLAARGHQVSLIRIGAASSVIYFLGLSFVQTPWQIYPMQILSGVSFAIMTNVAIVFFQDLIPGQPGLATTVFANASQVGNLLGYFCFGALVERVGHRGVFGMCGILVSVTLGVLIFYRQRSGAEPSLQPRLSDPPS